MYYTIFAKREENFLAKIDVAPARGATVAPLAGARIEMPHKYKFFAAIIVAPLAGARIEMSSERQTGMQRTSSLPSRERGLK